MVGYGTIRVEGGGQAISIRLQNLPSFFVLLDNLLKSFPTEIKVIKKTGKSGASKNNLAENDGNRMARLQCRFCAKHKKTDRKKMIFLYTKKKNGVRCT